VVSKLLAAIRERAPDPARYRDSGAESRRPLRAISIRMSTKRARTGATRLRPLIPASRRGFRIGWRE
jgi:hypothetical protein